MNYKYDAQWQQKNHKGKKKDEKLCIQNLSYIISVE